MGNAVSADRPAICIISNSLSINGGNNHILYLLRLFRERCALSVCSLSEGPVGAIFEELGVETTIFDPQQVPDFTRFSLVVGNTLLTAHILQEVHRQQVPYALILHENWPPEDFQKFIDIFEFSDRISAECMCAAFLNAKHIILPARALMQNYGSLLSSPASVHQINNICPLQDIQAYMKREDRESVRERLGLPDAAVVFLQLGTVCPRKNQLTTLKAFARLRQHRPDLTVHLIINGFRRLRKDELLYTQEIESYVRQENLTHCVSLFDVAMEEPYPYLLASDAMVLPSYNELLPQALMEAGAFSMPAISTNLDGIREIIEHGVNGFLTTPDDVEGIAVLMERLASDAELRKRMGSAFHDIVLQTRSEENLVKGYEPIFLPSHCNSRPSSL